jgi:hypothetical protein
LAAGTEIAWQATHADGCDETLGWRSPICHRAEAIGVLVLFDSALV